MKFLCDRCKTRYSIGDDRVRGKILKIRCKNCANVITVREGMTEADADASGPVEQPRSARPTTMAPPAASVMPATKGALGAAFANQLTKPPPALEEEWYVSIEGEQSGPFSLAEAQRWVASKPFDADLHCWSEGFDDWLPIDKVSHFRGLRKKPVAPTPPPMPRSAPRMQQQVVEEEPKALFAATMASLEKGLVPDSAAVAHVATAKGPGVPIAMATPQIAPSSLKTNGSAAPSPLAAKTTGSGSVAAMRTKATPVPAIPSMRPATPVPPIPTVPLRPATVPGVGGAMSPGAKALAAAFDVPSDVDDDPPDSLTMVEAPAFDDEILTRAEPVAMKRAFDRVDAQTFKAESEATMRAPQRAPSRLDDDDEPEEDNLDIGEVSRVVKLADLAKMGAPQRKISRAPLLRATGATPKLDLTPTPTGDPALAGLPLAADAPVDYLVPAPPVSTHRRGLIILIGVAVVLLVGVIGAVVLILTSDSSDDLPMGLGHATQIDTSRPEDPLHPRVAGDPGPGSGSATVPKQLRHWPIGPQIHPGSNTEPEVPVDPTRASLKAEEIEDMAAKQSNGTQRCYMRAQKGALGIEIGDLKKIAVTLTVDKEGTVTDVDLSDHSADALGKCLIARIKGWKFRQSPGGVFRIVLAFAAG